MTVRTWFGGPFDGRNIDVEAGLSHVAVAFRDNVATMEYPDLQRHVTDTEWWIHDPNIEGVKIKLFPCKESKTLGPVVVWREKSL